MSERVRAGIWIDRKEAVVVTINGETSSVDRILSNPESRPPSAQPLSASLREERQKNQLRRFLEAVIGDTRDATEVHILGPGEIRTALARMFRETPADSERLVGVGPAPRLTDAQLVARFKQLFASG